MDKKDVILNQEDRKAHLLLYITSKLQDAKYGGATNLNKVLYYIDGLTFINKGESISGFKYVKRPFGPTPDGEFIALRDAMLKNDLLRMDIRAFHGLEQKRLVPTQEADLELFSTSEIDLINDVIDYVGDMSAREISRITHNIVYDLAAMGEEIPLHGFILQPREPSEEDIAWGESIIANAHDYSFAPVSGRS
jgi:hypothetical protein